MTSVDQIVTDPQSSLSAQAKTTLKEFVVKLDKELAVYFDGELKNPLAISEKINKLSVEIWQHIREHNLRPAKRLRGSFIFYGYKLLGGTDDQAAMQAAMSIELIHTALLMHDDFMDQDALRRGEPTTNELFKRKHSIAKWWGDSQHYGESMAVDVGDVALLAGYQILAEASFPDKQKNEALKRQLRGVINTGIGQAFDITLQAEGQAMAQDVFDLHTAKTAIYTYENPLHIGAILAGATEEDLKLLSEYAMPGGIAFQLQDDVLGLFGDPDETGKSDFSDLIQRKVTLLVIKALESGDVQQKGRLLALWGKRDLTEPEANEFRQLIIDTGSLEYSRKTAIEWAQKAKAIIPQMRMKGWQREGCDYLEGIAQYMIERVV